LGRCLPCAGDGALAGKIKAGSVSNEIVSHMDWLPTFLAMAGEPDIKEKLKEGYIAGDKTFKVHLDGYNLLPYLTGQEKKSPRVEYFYFSGRRRSNGLALRTTGSLYSWSSAPPAHCGSGPSRLSLCACRSSTICAPTRTNAPTHIEYVLRLVPRPCLSPHARAVAVGAFLHTFKEFPPRQKAASFTVDQVMEKLTQGITSA